MAIVESSNKHYVLILKLGFYGLLIVLYLSKVCALRDLFDNFGVDEHVFVYSTEVCGHIL